MTTPVKTRQATATVPTTVYTHVAGSRTQVVGLALLAFAPLAMFGIGMVAGVPLAEGIPFLVIGVVLGVTSWVASRYGRWSTVLGVVLTVLVVLAGFWLAFGLLALASPGDFVPAVAFVVGVVLSLSGGIQALARRRDTTAPTRGETRAPVVAVGLVGVAIVASVAVNLAGRQSVDPATAEGAATVTMDAMAFTSGPVTVATGDDAAVVVTNQDAFLHDFSLPAQGIEVAVTPGSEALVDLSGLAAGTYTYYCSLHSDTTVADPEAAGMAGTLVVE